MANVDKGDRRDKRAFRIESPVAEPKMNIRTACVSAAALRRAPGRFSRLSKLVFRPRTIASASFETGILRAFSSSPPRKFAPPRNGVRTEPPKLSIKNKIGAALVDSLAFGGIVAMVAAFFGADSGVALSIGKWVFVLALLCKWL